MRDLKYEGQTVPQSISHKELKLEEEDSEGDRRRMEEVAREGGSKENARD